MVAAASIFPEAMMAYMQVRFWCKQIPWNGRMMVNVRSQSTEDSPYTVNLLDAKSNFLKQGDV